MGRLLQLCGALLMLVAIGLGLGFAPRADAEILAPLANALASLRSRAVTAAGGVLLPSATPTPRTYAVVRGGKITFGLTGSVSFGKQISAQTLNGGVLASASPSASPSPGGFIGSSPTSTSQSTSNEALGLFVELSRRTATTSTDLRVPLGFSVGSQGLVLGLSQLLYSTPHYALGYGSQSSSILGQLPSGSTERGFYEIVPTPGGDATFFQGPSLGALGETVPLYGVRLRDVNGRTLYTASLLSGTGPVTGKTRVLTVGSATSVKELTLVEELALEVRQDADLSPAGIAYQVRGDDGGAQSYLTAIVRHIPAGFVVFGNGEYFGDNYTDVAFHHNSSLQAFSFDSSSETIGETLDGGLSSNRQSTLTYSGPMRFGSYSTSFGSASTGGAGSTTSTQTQSAQIAANIGHGSLLLGDQLQRTTAQGAGTANLSQIGYNASLQQPLGHFSIGLTAGITTQYSDLSGRSQSIGDGVSLSRQFGKAAIQLGELFDRTQSSQSQAHTSNLQVAISRAISPVISVQTAFGIQSLMDPLNPASNGHSHTFSFQLNAPFSYGNGLVSGRADPRLPATIVGRVLTDISSNPGASFISSTGISNVQVILDDKTIQRTDVSGNFQFAFVAPGQHQVRLESGSLPRGVTVDIPVNTITVEGGQTAQMTFLVGSFGGIQGHVYGRDDSGAIVPIPNVQLRVDGGTYSQTDASGAYGFGRLRPGKHVITLIDNTVPAFASFDKAQETQTVSINNGVYTTVDFTAAPLGSISGIIRFAPDMGADAGFGVINAYVVAEPGEHAAIDNDDGSYVIDNLPPGVYTVSVDPETIPEGLGAAPDTLTVTLGSKEQYEGALFLVGHTEKKVVFSLVSGGTPASAPKVRLTEHRLPLLGTASVSVDAPADAGAVKVEGLGAAVALTYDAKRSLWVGEIRVPTNAGAGSHVITASVLHGTQAQSATLEVDPKMPIAIMQVTPANAPLGTYVSVRARFLVDVTAGDQIQWADGQSTTLGKPIAGRIFTFSLRVSLRPLHGLLLTKGARLPISLM